MIRHKIRPLFVGFLLISLLVMMRPGSAEDLMPVPKLTSPVIDTVPVLSDSDAAALKQKLLHFSRQTGSQIAILVVDSVAPEELFTYASRVWDEWRLGRKKLSDGVLILVAVTDHRVAIYPGSGLEGAIPDITARMIITQIIVPAFRKGDYYGGLNSATDALEKLIQGENFALPSEENLSQGDFWLALIGAFLILQVILYFFSFLFGRGPASVVSGFLTFGLAESFALSLGLSLAFGLFGVFFTYFGLVNYLLLLLNSASSGSGPRPPGGGGGLFGGGDGFSGGGGGFSGGGASGRW